MGCCPAAIRHNTQIHISHKISHHLQQNTSHKAAQRAKDTLHTLNTTQKSKAILVTDRGGL
jgi:hypothetical protein